MALRGWWKIKGEKMKDTIIITCLECGKEFAQYKQAINNHIIEGLICPYCNHVHIATDFIEALEKKWDEMYLKRRALKKHAPDRNTHRRIVL
jgi:DNA-directed RNA polymerase subunit RPC12/RpoP